MRYFFLIFQQCVMLKQHICFLKSVLFGAKIALKFEIDQVRYTWITTIITAAAVSKLLEKLEQKIDFLSKAKQQLRCAAVETCVGLLRFCRWPVELHFLMKMTAFHIIIILMIHIYTIALNSVLPTLKCYPSSCKRSIENIKIPSNLRIQFTGIEIRQNISFYEIFMLFFRGQILQKYTGHSCANFPQGLLNLLTFVFGFFLMF